MSFVYWARLPEHDDILTQGYVGITSRGVAQRWAEHVWCAKARKGCAILSKALRKYGDESIVVSALIQASQEYCMEIENKLRPDVGIGWNAGVGGANPFNGMPCSEETRAKMSESAKGRWSTPESREKMLAICEKNFSGSRGKKHSPEALEKIRAARRGRVLSPEVAKSVSDRARERTAGVKQSPQMVERRKEALRKRLAEDPSYREALCRGARKAWETRRANAAKDSDRRHKITDS